MLEVKNLSKIYDMGLVKVKALDDISFSIETGDMVCIMGKSGSGKSTLLRQLGLLDMPTSGEVILDDQVATSMSENARTQLRLQYLGYVFQEYALLGELTALENVYLPGMMLGLDKVNYKRRAAEILDLVGLGDRTDHYPKELSGGQQQRVAIARALINDPKILFADEPCANLDTLSSKLVMETLVKLNGDVGVTVIFVSHDPDDKKYARSIIVLSDGKTVSQQEFLNA
jgi:putative ABC transport system ATP-binding protein